MTVEGFRSGSGRAKIVIWLFIIGMFAEFISIGSDFADIELVYRIGANGEWTEAEAEANDLRSAVIAISDAIVVYAGMIAFLIWLYRVRNNLPALGIEDASWSPKWTIGWWFIPIMNLFRPFQAVKEIWQASGPDARPDSWRNTVTPDLLVWWWALFLIGWIVGNIAARLDLRSPETIDGIVNVSLGYIVAEALWIIATIPAILLVKEIDRRQTERHAALTRG